MVEILSSCPKGGDFFDGLKAAFCGSAGSPRSSDCLLPAVNQISIGISEESHRDFLTVVEPSPFRMMRRRGLAADWALPRQTHKPGAAAFRTMKKTSLLFHPAPSRPFFPGFPSVSICRFRLCFGGRALACSSNLKIVHSPPC